MKTYYFWVTPEGKGPMKVAEDGRTANEALSIVEARFPGARVILAEGFQWNLGNQNQRNIHGSRSIRVFLDWEPVMDFGFSVQEQENP